MLKVRFDAPSAAELAYVKFRQNDSNEAAALLRKALKKEPQLAKAHYYLGAVLYTKGEARAAEAEYREADKIDPSDPRPLTSLCQMQAQLKKDEVDATRKLISQRFGEQSRALLAQCSP